METLIACVIFDLFVLKLSPDCLNMIMIKRKKKNNINSKLKAFCYSEWKKSRNWKGAEWFPNSISAWKPVCMNLYAAKFNLDDALWIHVFDSILCFCFYEFV